MRLLNRLFSSKPQQPTHTNAVGAFAGSDPYTTYSSTLKWISETKAKLPDGTTFSVTPAMRETAFNTDPMLKGTIAPYLKNVVLGSYHIDTADNKKFTAMIDDIREFITSLQLLDVFRDDFIDYDIIHGHSYRRRDGDLNRLAKLDTATITVYRDPWDPEYVAYHQQIYLQDTWTSAAATTEHNSWFIPSGELYIEGDTEPPKAKAIFDSIAEKYGIDDTTNLRVDSADRIVAMHRVEPGDPAPIDNVVLAIWLKRLLLTNSPNIIFRVLSPFVHVKNGVLAEVSTNGDKQLLSSVPSQPPADLADIDPEQYAAESSAHTAWVAECKSVATTVIKALKDGGIFSSGPDTELEVVESGRTVPSEFIKTMLDILDEEIGQAFGFPVALIKANGSELATSRTILEFFNVAYAGVRQDYQSVADSLIREKFEGQSWEYEIVGKDGKTETGTFTFAEAAPSFVLGVGDTNEQTKIAQAKLLDAKRIEILKRLGASRGDIQAAADQAGFGALDLDKYDDAQAPTAPFGQSIKSTGKEDLKPFEGEDDRLKDDLMKAYKDAQASVADILE